MDATTLRRDAACELSAALDNAFFRALCEPMRMRILARLVEIGRADVAAIAAGFEQDRSVISRHLQVLKEAGVVFAEAAGRHVYYDIHGPSVVARLRDLTDRMAALTPTCCPGPGACA